MTADMSLNVEAERHGPEQLAGRVAKCYCGRTEPSGPGLAFFEYCGPGSNEALNQCAVCGFFRSAHVPGNWTQRQRPHEFVLREPRETDRFYCGCRGWD